MKNTFYNDWFKSDKAREAVSTWVRDPEGLLTGNGYCEGVYEIRFVNDDLHASTSAYIGQAGSVCGAPAYVAENVYMRLLQHMKRWFGNGYFTYWTGLSSDDKTWHIELHLLSEEKSHSERLRKESEFIAEKHPFLQDTADGEFELYPTKYGYSRNDLCIYPWKRKGDTEGQRRVAFLKRIKDILKNE